MKIYKDKSLIEEIQIFDLGIVPAGESKTYTYYVHNNSVATLAELVFKVKHKEVKVVKSPELLTPNDTKELILKWSPSVNIKKGLKTTIEILGNELWQ